MLSATRSSNSQLTGASSLIVLLLAGLLSSVALAAPLVSERREGKEGQLKVATSRETPRQESDCLKCHGKAGFGQKLAQRRNLFVDWKSLANSAHGSLTCTDCHSRLKNVPHEPFAPVRVECERCHEKAGSSVSQSAHGVALARGDSEIPSCVDCHGGHRIAPLTKGTVKLRRQLVSVCLKCHTSEPVAGRHNVLRSVVITAFQKSTHAEVARKGKKDNPVCSDCHGAHGPGPADREGDPVATAKFCGSCHGTELARWQGSVHAPGGGSNEQSATGCPQCHGEHRMRLWGSGKGSATRLARPCSTCHEAREVEVQLGLKSSYNKDNGKSYHGLVERFGRAYVSACETCHGYHDVRPASHPLSRINHRNLAGTCSRCHQGSKKLFISLRVHKPIVERATLTRWIRVLESPWIWLAAIGIVSILGFAVVIMYAWTGKIDGRSEPHRPPGGVPK